MPTRFVPFLLAAALMVAVKSDVSAQVTRTFLGGNPFGPTDWDNDLNWQGFIAPSAGDNVVISQNAFAVAGPGSRELNQVTLGSIPTPTARLEITQKSSMSIRSAFSVNAGRLDIVGAMQLLDGAQFFVSSGGTVRMDDGVSESQRGILTLGNNAIVFLDGLMEVGRLGSFNIGSITGQSQMNIGSTGELRVVGGRLAASVGSVYQLADGARALLSGTISEAVDFRLNGASSRVVVEQSDALSMGSFARRPILQSDVGGQVIYRGKGTMVSANMSGSNVRATVENETTLIQRDSTTGVSLTLQNLAQQLYFPVRSQVFVNSLGGPLTVRGQATLGLTSEFNAERFIVTSARLDVNNRLITDPGSTLHITRTGWDIAVGGGRFTVNMTSLLPWEIGANSTLVVNDWATLEGAGLTYLANPNLTTRMEGISTLDLTNSFGNRIINRLTGNSTSSRVEAGANRLTINGGDFSGQIVTSGGLRIGGDTTFRFPNSYSGGTEILVNGTLRLAGIGRMGSGPITIHGTLDVTAIDSASLLFTELGGAGLLRHGITRINLSVPSAGAVAIANSFQGSGVLTKEGSGTLRLTGNSTGTGQGDFLVNAGTLLVDGRIDRRFEVKSGAVLGGSGRVGEVLLQSGGLISPGNSTGTFFSKSTTWEAGAGYRWEINHAEGTPGGATGWDTLHVDGTLTLIPSALSRFTILVTSLGLDQSPGAASGFALNQTYDFPLVTTTNGIQGFTPSRVFLQTSSFNDGLGGQGTFSIFQNGNDLVLRYQTIPEPSSVLLLILAGGLLAWAARRARASSPAT